MKTNPKTFFHPVKTCHSYLMLRKEDIVLSRLNVDVKSSKTCQYSESQQINTLVPNGQGVKNRELHVTKFALLYWLSVLPDVFFRDALTCVHRQYLFCVQQL